MKVFSERSVECHFFRFPKLHLRSFITDLYNGDLLLYVLTIVYFVPFVTNETVITRISYRLKNLLKQKKGISQL